MLQLIVKLVNDLLNLFLRIAVNVFCKTMKELKEGFADDPETLLTYLNREGDTKLALSIDAEWKKRVLKVHTNNKREAPIDENGDKIKSEIYKA